MMQPAVQVCSWRISSLREQPFCSKQMSHGNSAQATAKSP